MSIFILLASFLPGFGVKDPITVENFANLVYGEFGMPNDMGIITADDELDPSSYISTKDAYLVLNQASGGTFTEIGSNKKLSASLAEDLVKNAQSSWANQTFGAPVAEQVTPDVIKFSGDFSPALQAAEIKTGNTVLQNAYVPQDETAGITQSDFDVISLLQKIDTSFSVGGFDVNLKVTDGGFIVGVGGSVATGVNVSKTFNVSNLNVYTNMDINMLTSNIKQSYLRLDYDLVDTTTVTGSYVASLKGGINEDGSPMDFFSSAKAGLLNLVNGGDNQINLFSFNVPVPYVPTVTISLDVKLRIDIYGRISIAVTSSQVQGYEIINNQARIIFDSNYEDMQIDIMADTRLTIAFVLSVKVAGVIIVDAEFAIGVGVKMSLYIKTDLEDYVIDMPIDLAMAVPNGDNFEFCANAKLYGLMSVSVGRNSAILKKLGLTKTWVIWDESNATFYNLHIEDNGDGGVAIVDQCTRARTR